LVLADVGVKPQTIEALNCITKSEVPFIVAINKIDKAGINLDKIKQNLAENEILVEGWGGTVPVVAISAKTGTGVPDLLEMITLQSDMEELCGNPSIPAEGFVIESNLSPKQGISATLVIKNGSLKTGMFVAAEDSYAPVRSIENYLGQNISEASFSSPVRIVGWNVQPRVGNEFKTFSKKEDALQFVTENSSKKNEENPIAASCNCALFEVVVKADTLGSLDAVEHELKKLGNEKIMVRIISKEVGAISENDIKTAKTKKSLVLGFNVNIDKCAEALAMRDGIEIKVYKIIYDLVDYVKAKIKEATPVETVETTTGSSKILKTFSQNKDKQVIGCRMEEGEIKTGSTVKIYRREALIGSGKVKELQTQKIKVSLVKEGQEFGAMVESKIELTPGDVLKATLMIEK
jgi:translation initiation factor IF-2